MINGCVCELLTVKSVLRILSKNNDIKEKCLKLTIGRYPAPVVAAIGCGVQPPAGPPVLAAFFGEFHCIPLREKKTKYLSISFSEMSPVHLRHLSRVYASYSNVGKGI